MFSEKFWLGFLLATVVWIAILTLIEIPDHVVIIKYDCETKWANDQNSLGV